MNTFYEKPKGTVKMNGNYEKLLKLFNEGKISFDEFDKLCKNVGETKILEDNRLAVNQKMKKKRRKHL